MYDEIVANSVRKRTYRADPQCAAQAAHIIAHQVSIFAGHGRDKIRVDTQTTGAVNITARHSLAANMTAR